MAKAVDSRQLALQALSRAVADPAPRLLHGSAKTGFFTGSAQAAKKAAEYLRDQGWVEPTGQFEGKGKSRKELFRITPQGVKEALASGEEIALLGDTKDYLVQNIEKLKEIDAKIGESLAALQKQREMVDALHERFKPPDLDRLLQSVRGDGVPRASSPPEGNWLEPAQDYLRDYARRNPLGHCPLPELFHRIAGPRGLTIGQFHDGLRGLVESGKARLHAFTGAAYTLQEDQLALVAGQEIKYYAESTARS